MLTSERQLWGLRSSGASKTKQLKSKCQRRCSTSGNRVRTGSISQWRGYVLKWMIKTSLLCLCFGVLFVGSTRLEYAGSTAPLYNVPQWNMSDRHSVAAGQVTCTLWPEKFRLLWNSYFHPWLGLGTNQQRRLVCCYAAVQSTTFSYASGATHSEAITA